jgi:hypothetical protein
MEISRERPLGGEELANALLAASLVEPEPGEDCLVVSIPPSEDAVSYEFTDEASAHAQTTRLRAQGHTVGIWKRIG